MSTAVSLLGNSLIHEEINNYAATAANMRTLNEDNIY
jgi:hypothetical protein